MPTQTSCPAPRRDEHCLPADVVSSRAADRAVKKVFAILGVDVDRPESVEEFRADLRFGRNLRRVTGHGILAFGAVVAGAIAVAIWSGISAYFSGGKS